MYLDAQRASARSAQPASFDPAVPTATISGIQMTAPESAPTNSASNEEKIQGTPNDGKTAKASSSPVPATTARANTADNSLQSTKLREEAKLLERPVSLPQLPVPIGAKAITRPQHKPLQPIVAGTKMTGIVDHATKSGSAIRSASFSLSDQSNSIPSAPPHEPTDAADTIPRVSEVFEETDIREAIRVLGQLANQSVVIDDNVGGYTSATIENETFENALRKITLPLGLVFAQHRGQYLIGTSDPSSSLFPYLSVTYRYEPQHRASKALIELLPERLRQYIHVGENWNIVVVDGPESIGQEIVNRLRDLDQPVPQVLLEAIICVVAPDSGFRFGVDWNHALTQDSTKSLDVGVKNLSFTGMATQAGIKNAFEDFAVTSAFVQALADQGYITIRATPRVFAKDGEKAEIIIGRETFFSLQPTNTSSLLFRPDVQKVIAGITLTIIPHVRGENVSVLVEKAEVSEDIRTSTAQLSSNPYPIINRRTVTTTAHVRDGHTIAIGGLVQRQTVDRVSKIPVLGDIPMVGKLFQTMETQEQDVEIAIFISPRIVKPCADSPIDNSIMISPQTHENLK